jgi:hypothetical protein
MADDSAADSPQSDPKAEPLPAGFIAEVADATMVLDYAIANGVLGPNNQKLDDGLITAIKNAQDIVAKGAATSAAERTLFEVAYRDLALFVSPVTAETLKATSESFAIKSLFFTLLGPRPIAIVWSRKLSTWTLIIIAAALIGNWITEVQGPIPELSDRDPVNFPTRTQGTQIFFELLVPFTYGAIGACVSLLKACQAFIHMRQFDPRRIPEYYNRMILGSVSGGMIVLLVNQISGDDGTQIKLSAAALGFLAGYNNDLLFSAIERISNAILPKVGIDSVRRDGPYKGNVAAVADVSLKDLLDRHKNAANPKEQKLYADLIQKIQNRI